MTLKVIVVNRQLQLWDEHVDQVTRYRERDLVAVYRLPSDWSGRIDVHSAGPRVLLDGQELRPELVLRDWRS